MHASYHLRDTPPLSDRVRRLAFIPARGGSKGLPRKNILDLCGKPLIAYTIQAALDCGGFDRVVVSTNDEEIADVSRRYGADVPVLRPAEFARDDSPLSQALHHMLDHYRDKGEVFNVCAEMYPTSPFRTPGLLRLLLSKLDAGYRSVRTAHCRPLDRVRYYPENDPDARPVTAVRPAAARSGIFFLGLFNGYWIEPNRPVWGTYVHNIAAPAERVDIDNQVDFDLARYIVENDLYDTGRGEAHAQFR